MNNIIMAIVNNIVDLLHIAKNILPIGLNVIDSTSK